MNAVVSILAASFAIMACGAPAGAEEPKQPPPVIDVALQQLYALYDVMLDQLELMRSQQQQWQMLRLDLLRACGQRQRLWENDPDRR
jgi:hypothetical protein